MQNKCFNGKITGHKQIDRAGVPVGIIEGYIATWDTDRGNDRFEKGAFANAIERHRKNNRPIRLKNQHMRTIGGWPIESVKEDDRGLFGIGEINLDTQEGREAYSLVKQGVLSDLSIGYGVIHAEYDKNIRVIKESEVWEGSIVDEPMNPEAVITGVKTVNQRSKLPKDFADRSLKWDSSAAEKRIRTWAGAEEGPNEKYKSAFLWYDNADEENFTAYKLQIADIVDDSIKIIPRAVFAVRAALAGARGGVDIPDADIEKIKTIINGLYTEMELEEPFDGKSYRPFSLDEIKGLSKSLLANVIRYCELSKKASTYIATLSLPQIMAEESTGELVEELKSVIDMAKKIKLEMKHGRDKK